MSSGGDRSHATVDALLARARALGLTHLDSTLLASHALGRTRPWVLAHGEVRIDQASADRFDTLCEARVRGTPIAYLVGTREFHGLNLRITSEVLDPRPDTETLVDWALELLSPWTPPCVQPRVADLGTGSGAIALAIKASWPMADVVAVERSTAALAVAQDNCRRLGLVVEFVAGSWFEPLTGSSFDLIVGNVPYLAADDPHLAALHAEPREALVAQDDGLADLFFIVDHATHHLQPEGWLLLEHGSTQGPALRRRFEDAGFGAIRTRRDLAGLERCTGGQWQGRDSVGPRPAGAHGAARLSGPVPAGLDYPLRGVSRP